MICACGTKLCKLKMVSDILDHPVHVYYKNIQRSSSLKPLGQSEPNFIGSFYGKGESMCL